MAKENKSPENTEKQRIMTPEFTVFYPHVFKPHSVKGSAPKYSITMAFPKTGDLSVLKLAIKHAKIDAFGPNKENWPEDLESPVIDGDLPKYASRAGHVGHWVIKASSHEAQKPGVVDYPNADPILNQSDFYPGCKARAQVFARVWEYMGKQGVHFILDHVQKTKDGTPIGGKKSAKEVFGAMAASSNEEDEDDDFT